MLNIFFLNLELYSVLANLPLVDPFRYCNKYVDFKCIATKCHCIFQEVHMHCTIYCSIFNFHRENHSFGSLAVWALGVIQQANHEAGILDLYPVPSFHLAVPQGKWRGSRIPPPKLWAHDKDGCTSHAPVAQAKQCSHNVSAVEEQLGGQQEDWHAVSSARITHRRSRECVAAARRLSYTPSSFRKPHENLYLFNFVEQLESFHCLSTIL